MPNEVDSRHYSLDIPIYSMHSRFSGTIMHSFFNVTAELQRGNESRQAMDEGS
jgi:hypothetical protein